MPSPSFPCCNHYQSTDAVAPTIPLFRPQALEGKKRIVLVREVDGRQGGPRTFPADSPPTVRCGAPGGCRQQATRGAPGAAWPSRCEGHADPTEMAAGPIGIDRSRVGDDALAYSLIFEGTGATTCVDADALDLATTVLGLGGGAPAPHALVCGDLRFFSELEFRNISMGKLLEATGMRKGATPAAAAGAKSRTEGEALRETLRLLAMGVPAPPLPPGCTHHVCIVHDPTCPSAHSVCSSLAAALAEAFQGARVATLGKDPKALVAAAGASACVVPFLTRGLLCAGSPAAAAVAAGLRAKRRFVVPYEFEFDRGGTPSVQDLISGTAHEAKGLWEFTGFPWLGTDADLTEICALRLALDGIMEPADTPADSLLHTPAADTKVDAQVVAPSVAAAPALPAAALGKAPSAARACAPTGAQAAAPPGPASKSAAGKKQPPSPSAAVPTAAVPAAAAGAAASDQLLQVLQREAAALREALAASSARNAVLQRERDEAAERAARLEAAEAVRRAVGRLFDVLDDAE